MQDHYCQGQEGPRAELEASCHDSLCLSHKCAVGLTTGDISPIRDRGPHIGIETRVHLHLYRLQLLELSIQLGFQESTLGLGVDDKAVPDIDRE